MLKNDKKDFFCKFLKMFNRLFFKKNRSDMSLLYKTSCIEKQHPLNYKKYNDIAFDIKNNIKKIPSDIDLIIGIPRSGIVPAYMMALMLNKQVCSLPEFLSGNLGAHGITRKINVSKKIEKILVVDDTCNTGMSIRKVKRELEPFSEKYQFVYMAVYGKDQSTFDNTDIILEFLPQPRMFQWNYLNHAFLRSAGLDMDGVLCIDPTPEQNDDGKKYKDFILNARPLYIPKNKIGAIVTSRLEKYRPETELWLKKHGIEYDALYMLKNIATEGRRNLNVHAKYKADILKEHKELKFFIESDENQAKEIAKLTNKPVFCSTNDTLY